MSAATEGRALPADETLRCHGCGAPLMRWNDGKIGCPDFCGQFGPGERADPDWLAQKVARANRESETRLRAEMGHAGLWKRGTDGGFYREFRGDDVQGLINLLDEARKHAAGLRAALASAQPYLWHTVGCVALDTDEDRCDCGLADDVTPAVRAALAASEVAP